MIGKKSIKEGYVMPLKPEQPTEMLLPENLKWLSICDNGNRNIIRCIEFVCLFNVFNRLTVVKTETVRHGANL